MLTATTKSVNVNWFVDNVKYYDRDEALGCRVLMLSDHIFLQLIRFAHNFLKMKS